MEERLQSLLTKNADRTDQTTAGVTAKYNVHKKEGNVTYLTCSRAFGVLQNDDAAVMAALDEASKSPEARACQAAFRELRAELPEILKECGSGRELQELGFAEDVSFAAELDRFDVVPVLSDGWLVDHQAVD